MSPLPITLYIDLKSPYAWVAAHRAVTLERTGTAAFQFRPFTLDVAARAAASDADDWMRRIRYLYADVRRFAAPLGLSVRGPKRVYDSTVANAGLLYIQTPGVRRDYIALAFARFFNREFEMDDIQAVVSLLHGCGADGAGFEAWLAREGRDRLAEVQRAAEAKGVFGVPSFVVDDELFWGQDRMEMALHRARVEIEP